PPEPSRAVGRQRRIGSLLQDSAPARIRRDGGGWIRLFPDREAGHRLPDRESRGPYFAPGSSPLVGIHDHPGSLRPGGAGGGPLALDPSEKNQILHRLGDLVFVRPSSL